MEAPLNCGIHTWKPAEDRLTALGVAVVPWMTLFVFDANGEVAESVVGDSIPCCDDGNPQGEPWNEADWYYGKADHTWSTREAAEAAAKENNDG